MEDINSGEKLGNVPRPPPFWSWAAARVPPSSVGPAVHQRGPPWGQDSREPAHTLSRRAVERDPVVNTERSLKCQVSLLWHLII